MPDQTPHPDSLHLRIRARPGMYIGGLNSRGLRHVLTDIISEQLAAPHARFSHVAVSLLPDDFLCVEFTGDAAHVRPEHFAAAPSEAVDAPFLSLTIAAALSDPFQAELIRDGHRWSQTFNAGLPAAPPQLDAADSPARFRLLFRPDPALFKGIPVGFLRLCAGLQELAIFHPAMRFRVQDDTDAGLCRDYHYPGGLASYADEVDLNIVARKQWNVELSDGAESARAVIFHSGVGPYTLHAFVNGERILDGGSHVDGFERAFTELSLRPLGPAADLFLYRTNPLVGMTVILALNLTQPEWAFATRTRLDGPRPRDLVYRMILTQLPAEIARTTDDVSPR